MVELEPHKPGRRFDRHFRWRGTEVSRIEAIADAVFGLVLAMLLLKEHPPESFGALFDVLRGLLPLAVTFACVARIWLEHYLFFRRFDLHDGPSIALTFLLLFLVVAYAYPLKLIFTAFLMNFIGPIGELTMKHIIEGASVCSVFVVFSLGFCAIYATLVLLYRQALRRRTELELDEVETFLTRSTIQGLGLQLSVGLLSVALAIAGLVAGADSVLSRVGLPGWIYFLIGPLMGIHGTRQGRGLRQLGAG